MTYTFAEEISEGKRFGFGKNWAQFLKTLNPQRIELAKHSLQSMLSMNNLAGKTFIDVGCGSGLFSLAARQLGAHVRSFDFDPDSVVCAMELRKKYSKIDPQWMIEEGSALDADYIRSLGKYDVVYSWGVLHHTGNLWQALRNVTELVRPGGTLFISIYNDQGWISAYWKFMKRLYNRNSMGKCAVIALHFPYLMMLAQLVRAIKGGARLKRGMSPWRDFLDWLGGLPFEVANPRDIVGYLEKRGFSLLRLKTCGRRHGCNEYVFRL